MPAWFPRTIGHRIRTLVATGSSGRPATSSILPRYLTGAPITDFRRTTLSSGYTTSFQFTFADGSIGTVHYFANGNRHFPKERLEVFCGGRTLQLDNFRKAPSFGWEGFSR